jgi:GTP-binding protein YchF
LWGVLKKSNCKTLKKSLSSKTMSLQIGIVGLPNAGKSTLFNALTESTQAEAQNFPFCTIDPNVGRVAVPDMRLEKLADIAGSLKVIPESIEFVDIAGLVKGASKGEGLGNKFLANIRETDAVCIVLRFFADSDIHHVLGSHDPLRDKEILETELILKDLDTTEKALEKAERDSKSGNKEKILERDALKKIYDRLSEGKKAKGVELDEKEQEVLYKLHLLTDKKYLYIANVADDEVSTFDYEQAKKTLDLSEDEEIVAISARIESEIALLDRSEKAEFLESMGLEESGLSRLICKAFEALDLISYFTVGEKEARAWAINRDTLAPQAAGKIHTDFEKGFIRADMVKTADFIEHGGWSKAREKGVVHSVGKDYVVQDGDILLFKFNV